MSGHFEHDDRRARRGEELYATRNRTHNLKVYSTMAPEALDELTRIARAEYARGREDGPLFNWRKLSVPTPKSWPNGTQARSLVVPLGGILIGLALTAVVGVALGVAMGSLTAFAYFTSLVLVDVVLSALYWVAFPDKKNGKLVYRLLDRLFPPEGK